VIRVPQSNQRGIETAVVDEAEYIADEVPQSNQRGIETP
jgi:hypothetical protein